MRVSLETYPVTLVDFILEGSVVCTFLAFAHTDMGKLVSSCREGLEKLKSELHESIQKGVKFVQNPPAPKK